MRIVGSPHVVLEVVVFNRGFCFEARHETCPDEEIGVAVLTWTSWYDIAHGQSGLMPGRVELVHHVRPPDAGVLSKDTLEPGVPLKDATEYHAAQPTTRWPPGAFEQDQRV